MRKRKPKPKMCWYPPEPWDLGDISQKYDTSVVRDAKGEHIVTCNYEGLWLVEPS